MRPRRHDAREGRTKKKVSSSCIFVGFAFSWYVSSGHAQTAVSKPVTYKSLEMSVASVDRAPSASLKDCPPGGNTVNAMSRPGEEFAVVTVKFKVLPGFEPTPMKRPVLTDAAGKTYNTAVSFVDVGSVPEFSCAIPFRVPAGTAVKSLQIDNASLDLTSAETKK